MTLFRIFCIDRNYRKDMEGAAGHANGQFASAAPSMPLLSRLRNNRQIDEIVATRSRGVEQRLVGSAPVDDDGQRVL
jgi:hypothetical protein